jgi:hypothetical protein
LLLPEASPKRPVLIRSDSPSCHLNWTYLINAGRRHLHPCTQLKRRPCNLHAILMGRRHTTLIDAIIPRTLN